MHDRGNNCSELVLVLLQIFVSSHKCWRLHQIYFKEQYIYNAHISKTPFWEKIYVEEIYSKLLLSPLFLGVKTQQCKNLSTSQNLI